MLNDTALIFETPNPYEDNSECIVNFNRRGSLTLSYSIQRFEMESHETCDYDYLGMYIIELIILYDFSYPCAK